MEEVLDVLNQPRDEHAPVVALDERPVQVLGSVRPDRPMAPGQPARSDYEYARCGTANVFCVVEPQAGRHHTHATENRTAGQCAGALKRIALSYPEASTIHLVLDNLNTPLRKNRSPQPSVRKRGTSCGVGSRCTTRLSMAAGLIRQNWKPACGRGNAWVASGLRRLPSCAAAPAPGTGGRITPKSKSTGASLRLMRVACSTTNQSLRMSRCNRSSVGNLWNGA